jgi:putative endonuclease
MAAVGKFSRLWIDVEEWLLGRIAGLRGPAMASHLATGVAGERAAYFEMKRRGYRLVAQRWTSARLRGDIDLIGWDGDRLCFVEVKTRTERDNTPAESAVDEDKREMVRSLARAYLRALPEHQRGAIPVRFDVVSVYSTGDASQFEFFQNAFGWQ